MHTYSITAVRWSAVDQIIRALCQIASILIVTRLLSPQEFGLNALALAIVSIAGIFAELGLGALVIQRRDLDASLASSLYSAQLLAGGVVLAVVLALASAISEFFNNENLRPILRFMALGNFIYIVSTIPLALLERNLRFSTGAIARALANLLGLGVAILLASNGFGAWALAWQYVSTAAIFGLVVVMVAPIAPGPLHHMKNIYPDVRQFCVNLQVSSLLEVVHAQLGTILIGRYYGTGDLGLFNRATAVSQFAPSLAGSIAAQIALPLYSRAAADNVSFDKLLRRSVGVAMAVVAPISIGLALTASEVTSIVFGDRWTGAAELVAILALAGMFWPLNILLRQALLAQGLTSAYLAAESLKKAIGVGILLSCLSFGLGAIAVSVLLSNITSVLICWYYLRRFTATSIRKHAQVLAPICAAGLLMVAIAATIEYVFRINAVFLLLLKIGLCGAAYVGLLAALQNDSLKDVFRLVFRRMTKTA